MEEKILRTRFAPSPTGYLHVGGARTALYNYLVTQKAKRNGFGEFILRIEDTDEERNRDEWTKGIIESLKWLGIDWDSGPFFQSQRLDLYRESANRLFQAGLSYWCDCTRDEIDRRNKENSRPPGYDKFCRDRGLGQAPGRIL
ncbi:MAG: glutamate--tRNA ligase, partial [Acidimicrobiales bacterium]|nr:glutamate--tRNA ligase [Acidimicrobiales bacterium]